MPSYITVTIIIVVAVTILIATIRAISMKVQKRMLEEIERRFDGKKIHSMTSSANFFGLTSKGIGQTRGQGALVLAEDELFFLMAVPKKEYSIPYNKITEVDLKKSHLGKSIGRDLLHVSFDTEYDQDSIAWSVREPGQWKMAIDKLRGA